LNFGRHIGHQTPDLGSDKKPFFCEICPTKMQAQIKKQNAKIKFKVQNSLSYGRKIQFSAILKITITLKTCVKNFPFCLNFQALIFIQNVAKIKIFKNKLFETMSFL
jgi:hypothetical protein